MSVADEDLSLLVSRRSSGLPMEIRINPRGYPACIKVGLALVGVEPPEIIEGRLGANDFTVSAPSHTRYAA